MPRLAKVLQILPAYLPPYCAVSAIRMALRMSSIDGLAGASSIARVTRLSVTREPTLSRSDQRASPQISPSACTSGNEMILP